MPNKPEGGVSQEAWLQHAHAPERMQSEALSHGTALIPQTPGVQHGCGSLSSRSSLAYSANRVIHALPYLY